MAGGQERILRGRIRSIQATKKITRAMELIAASRIVKAQQRVHAAVPYSDQITEVVKDLAASGASSDSPLLAGRGEIKKTCYVAITADRGLCGGYNAGVQRAAEGEVKADVLAGQRLRRSSRSAARPRATSGSAATTSAGRSPASPTSRPTPTPGAIGEHVVDLFTSGEVDSVELVYTRFVSAGTQEVVLRPLVPLHGETITGGDGQAAGADGARAPAATTSSSRTRPRSSTRCCRATSRPASTPRCSTPRRPSTPSASGR